jgi:hypothetical protein
MPIGCSNPDSPIPFNNLKFIDGQEFQGRLKLIESGWIKKNKFSVIKTNCLYILSYCVYGSRHPHFDADRLRQSEFDIE